MIFIFEIDKIFELDFGGVVDVVKTRLVEEGNKTEF